MLCGASFIGSSLLQPAGQRGPGHVLLGDYVALSGDIPGDLTPGLAGPNSMWNPLDGLSEGGRRLRYSEIGKIPAAALRCKPLQQF